MTVIKYLGMDVNPVCTPTSGNNFIFSGHVGEHKPHNTYVAADYLGAYLERPDGKPNSYGTVQFATKIPGQGDYREHIGPDAHPADPPHYGPPTAEEEAILKDTVMSKESFGLANPQGELGNFEPSHRAEALIGAAVQACKIKLKKPGPGPSQ